MMITMMFKLHFLLHIWFNKQGPLTCLSQGFLSHILYCISLVNFLSQSSFYSSCISCFFNIFSCKFSRTFSHNSHCFLSHFVWNFSCKSPLFFRSQFSCNARTFLAYFLSVFSAQFSHNSRCVLSLFSTQSSRFSLTIFVISLTGNV